MANALPIQVVETLQELKTLLKNSPLHIGVRIKMLIEIKASDVSLSKTELAHRVGANHNSIQAWRTKYHKGGLAALVQDGRIGFKPPMLAKAIHKKIEMKLQSTEPSFTSYKQLHQWVEKQCNKPINYNSLRHYVKRHFGAKLKVARKSHIRKDAQAVKLFKKTSKKPAPIK